MTLVDIDAFVESLAQVPSTEFVANPYHDEARRSNLWNYLRHLQHAGFDAMLIGEAPGYKGCAKTGIPFTDPRQLNNPANEFALGAWDRRLPANVSPADSEETASNVWPVIRQSGVVPLMWNIYPFHPHEKGNASSNRTPTPAELAEGQRFAEALISLLDVQPEQIYAIGRKAQAQLGLGDDYYIRHPSYGGSRHFAEHFASKVVANVA